MASSMARYDDSADEDGELLDDEDDNRTMGGLRRGTAGPQTPPEPHQMIIGNESDDGQEDALTIKPPQAQTHKERAERVKERAERRERKWARKSSDTSTVHRSKDRHRSRPTQSDPRPSDRSNRTSGGRASRRSGDGRVRRRKDAVSKESTDSSSSIGRRSGGRTDDDVVVLKVERPDRSREREKERIDRERERMESEKRRDRLIYADRERERLRERQKRESEARRLQESSSAPSSRDRSPIGQERTKNADRDSSTRTRRHSPRVVAAEPSIQVEQRRVIMTEEYEEHLIIRASDHEDLEEEAEEDNENENEKNADKKGVDEVDNDLDEITVEALSASSDNEEDVEEAVDQVEEPHQMDDRDEDKDALSVNGGDDGSSDASSDKTDEGRTTGSEASTPDSQDEEANGDDDAGTDGGEANVAEDGEEEKPEDGDDDEAVAGRFLVDDSPLPANTEPELPPYLPAIQGCRNVEEFDCLNRIEEGTYGVVYRARHKKTQEIVALKRLKMEKERDGFPITSLREINTLLKAQHPNIVTVREIVVGSNMDKIYIVMDYVEHDLKSLMETMRQPFLIGEVKTLMIQLLRAVAHLHDNWILHRDLKTSNLLLSHKGVLKVGDFGLAREYGSPLKHYTPVVVTLWYRAPELLLGSKDYSTPIDVWSVGCIFGELLTMKPLFPGKSDINQLNCIFKDMGTPSEKIWPGYSELPMVKRVTFADIPYSNLRRRFEPTFTNCGMDLLNKLLYFDPKRRVSAEEALKHKYFAESPKPVDPSLFPTWPAKSELAAHVRTQQSPKPPSGGKQYAKQLANDDEDVACAGFHMGEPQNTAVPRAGEMFRLRF